MYLQRHCGNGFFWQCLPFSWTTLRGRHCWHLPCYIGVVDTGNDIKAFSKEQLTIEKKKTIKPIFSVLCVLLHAIAQRASLE